MITTEPQIADTSRLSIKQVCEVLEICRTSLQNYTKAGTIKCGHRKANMRPFYFGHEVKRFWKATF